MLQRRLLLLILCSPAILRTAVAFETRFEPLKGGYGGSRRRIWKAEFSGDHQEEKEEHRHHQSRGYTLHFENRYESVDGETIHSRLFISEPFVLDAAMFGVANPYEAAVDPALPAVDTPTENYEDVDDSQDCAIPDEYKKMAELTQVDVMAFLGIKRAVPLRANGLSDAVGEWE